MTRRLRWTALGVLLAIAAAGWGVAAIRRAGREVMTARQQAAAAEALGAKLARQVDELQLSEADARALADSLGEKVLDARGRLTEQVRLTARWRAQAERRPAAVTTGPADAPVTHEPAQPVEVAAGCELSEPTLEGDCTADVFMLGDRPAARFSWSATAAGMINGEPFTITSPLRPAQQVEGEVAKQVPVPLRSLLALSAGAWGEADAVGLRVEAHRWAAGKRLGWWAGLDYSIDPASVASPGYSFEADRLRVAGGVALRLGRK